MFATCVLESLENLVVLSYSFLFKKFFIKGSPQALGKGVTMYNKLILSIYLSIIYVLFLCVFQSSHKDMSIDFRDRGREERNTDVKSINWLPPIRTPTGDHTRNLGMCPNRESNL